MVEFNDVFKYFIVLRFKLHSIAFKAIRDLATNKLVSLTFYLLSS